MMRQGCAAAIGAGLWLVLATGGALGQQQATFPSPEAAVAALLSALEADDPEAVLAVLGSEHADELLGDDPDAAREEQQRFLASAEVYLELRPAGENREIAYVGPRAVPFPIPIVADGEAWYFDTVAGIDELANRRIGGNELRTIDSMRAYVTAQNLYASADRDGDEVLEYAQHIRSTPGQHDGLYWAAADDQEQSPLGPLLAAAVDSHEPGDAYNGYYYRVLTRQGANPPGGAYDYVINGNMIAGFGLVAWPAEYDHSGIMTFVVNHQGRVYEQDLGPETAEIAAAIEAYDPDASWPEVTD